MVSQCTQEASFPFVLGSFGRSNYAIGSSPVDALDDDVGAVDKPVERLPVKLVVGCSRIIRCFVRDCVKSSNVQHILTAVVTLLGVGGAKGIATYGTTRIETALSGIVYTYHRQFATLRRFKSCRFGNAIVRQQLCCILIAGDGHQSHKDEGSREKEVNILYESFHLLPRFLV